MVQAGLLPPVGCAPPRGATGRLVRRLDEFGRMTALVWVILQFVPWRH